jgi:hypothetical protein
VSSVPAPNAGFRAIQRRFAEGLGGARRDPGDTATLESRRVTPAEPPRLTQARPIEPGGMQRHPLSGPPDVGASAFLDGIQASRVIGYDETIPIVHGAVGAVVRVRSDRRLTTWRSTTEERVYAPRALLSRAANQLLDDFRVEVVDTTRRRQDGAVEDDAHHPLNLAEAAVAAVQWHRESVEVRLAEAWAAQGDSILYMDGGSSGSRDVATSPKIIGVVKSHRTLYGEPSTARLVLSLAEGERSSVFAIEPPDRRRSPVASWYLRLRDPAGHDPLWGLVRIEVPVMDPAAAADRADMVSRWVAAEASPVALPDGRWDTMAYGIRDCEQYLRSIA